MDLRNQHPRGLQRQRKSAVQALAVRGPWGINDPIRQQGRPPQRRHDVSITGVIAVQSVQLA